jgi:uncharacterized protein (DUF488 family)
MSAEAKTIWTIGHSTHTIEMFVAMLKAYEIAVLADIRTFPGSRRYPHFNKEALAQSLEQSGISYIHMPGLGGRRKPKPDSQNTEWKNAGFRGYADYMETAEFKQATSVLEETALNQRTAYMCSEAVWWRCHRALVSDYLKLNGWKVMHIMSETKAEEHPFTTPTRAKQGKLFGD